MKKLHLFCPASILAAPDANRQLAPAILAGFQALWHPDFLRQTDAPPSISDPAEKPADEDWIGVRLAALPTPAWTPEPGRMVVAAPENAGPAGIDALIAPLELKDCAADHRADFYALGFAVLGLDVLFGQMKQPNPVDAWAVFHEAQQAANHLYDGDLDRCADSLRNAFEALHNARQLTYPATINLVDLALWPPGVDEAMFEERLKWRAPVNVVLAGRELDAMAESNPDFLAKLKSAVDSQQIEVVGGAYDDRPWTLLGLPERLWQMGRAAESYRKHLGRELDCFASRTLALTPDVPQLLMKFQYRYALHAVFDGSLAPHFKDAKLHWTAADGSAIETLARTARDASSEVDAFAAIGSLAASLEHDRAPTLVLAHWFGVQSWWMHWLIRTNEFAPVFGRLQTMQDYFLNSSIADSPTSTRADEYGSNRLRTALVRGEASAISGSIDSAAHRGKFDAVRALTALQRIVTAGEAPVPNDLDSLEDAVESSSIDDAWNQRLASIESDAMASIAELVLGDAEELPGALLVNPCSFTRRVGVYVEDIASDVRTAAPLRAVQESGGKTAIVVDVPAWGYAWVPRRAAPGDGVDSSESKAPAMAAGRRIRNEYIELEVDAGTGGIRGVWDNRSGYSRLGQQIVFGGGSRMVGTSRNVTSTGPSFGEIVTEGDVQSADGKKKLASFRQTVRVWRASPVLEMSIQLTLATELGRNPETDYFAIRWAWPDEKTTVSVLDGHVIRSHKGTELESPSLFQLRERNVVTSILPQGLPFHKRISPRLADTLLVVAGEPRRDFNLSIAFDFSYPMTAVQESTWPVFVKNVDRGPPKRGATGWFAQLGLSHVQAIGLLPTPEGVRLQLAETSGKQGRAEFRTCRDPRGAKLVNGRGELVYDLYPVGDSLPIDFSPCELVIADIRYVDAEPTYEPFEGTD